MTSLELQEKFIAELLKCVTVDWDRIAVHYEYILWKGNVFEKYTARSFLQDAGTDIDFPFEFVDLMLEMRNAKPDGQAEHWTSMDFKLDTAGKYNFDYGYGMPPMTARTLAAQPRKPG